MSVLSAQLSRRFAIRLGFQGRERWHLRPSGTGSTGHTDLSATSSFFGCPDLFVPGWIGSLIGANFGAVDRGEDLFHPSFGVELVERGQAEGVQKRLRCPPDPFAPGAKARGARDEPAVQRGAAGQWRVQE